MPLHLTIKDDRLVYACRRRLVEVGGRASSVRAQELTELQSVAVAQHLEVNPFAKAARAQRSTLVLCTYSFELLMHYLQSSKQWLILNIINQHVRFEVCTPCLTTVHQHPGTRI